ncbi:MAG: KH domain-containing protein [Candidatus Enterosoma sp.]|nr:KH domain-containing protein [Bacilli bacterium]MDD7606953.1 KH domain-containing protein [bacterium]MDY3907300.1 KH domain-containing protein [Candidatus Enterosoma sp.]MDY5649780.1 KH domain-containing protein [Candidatus Enterosoma sp.]MDY5866443.1 KH domain-containing protein [Candidatus Enterosoma sp.]
MDYQASIDLTSDIRLLVEPLVTHPEKIVIKRLDKEEDLYKKEQNYLVLCDKDDLGRLIGRHGVISDSLRTILNVSNKNMRKRIHLRFASNEETNE